MKITSRFAIAVHSLVFIHVFGRECKTTSELIASSVNVNPVIIRRVLQGLKAAGIIEVKAGSGGASVVKDLNDITLYDIYKAVDCVEDGLFSFHENPNPNCPVGRSIHDVLDTHMNAAQTAMENSLKGVTLADIVERYA